MQTDAPSPSYAPADAQRDWEVHSISKLSQSSSTAPLLAPQINQIDRLHIEGQRSRVILFSNVKIFVFLIFVCTVDICIIPKFAPKFSRYTVVIIPDVIVLIRFTSAFCKYSAVILFR